MSLFFVLVNMTPPNLLRIDSKVTEGLNFGQMQLKSYAPADKQPVPVSTPVHEMEPLPEPLLLVTADAALAAEILPLLGDAHLPCHWAKDRHELLRHALEAEEPLILLFDERVQDVSPAELTAEVHFKKRLPTLWTILLRRGDQARPALDGVQDSLFLPLSEQALASRLHAARHALALMRQLDHQHRTARFHAEHDALTGLWNREALLRLLHTETDRAQRQGSPVALVLLDLDHFSQVNLDFGYEAADKILQELARRFRRHLRSYDLVGRCGEDEFLFALPASSSEEAAHFTARLRQSIFGKPFFIGRDELTISASVGIAHSVGRSPMVVLREAERALASAKAGGRNRQQLYSILEQNQPLKAVSGLRVVRSSTTRH